MDRNESFDWLSKIVQIVRPSPIGLFSRRFFQRNIFNEHIFTPMAESSQHSHISTWGANIDPTFFERKNKELIHNLSTKYNFDFETGKSFGLPNIIHQESFEENTGHVSPRIARSPLEFFKSTSPRH
jgi:hypothetical protein